MTSSGNIGAPARQTGRRDGGGRFEFFVATSKGLVPVARFTDARRSPGLSALVAHEIEGERQEPVPKRVEELCRMFGLDWEPIAEVGHMRFACGGAFLLDRARQYASHTAQSIARALDMPFFQVEGVNVIDDSAAAMAQYLALTENEPGVYQGQYRIGSNLLLRQTGCVQKFSICRDWTFTPDSLPMAVFELSDSYRAEPEENLRLSFRLRRFRLPETHVHAVAGRAAGLSLKLHHLVLQELAGVTDDVEMFASAPHAFVTAHPGYFRKLAAVAGRPFLLKVYPPGAICQDGVEVDFEYKVIDSIGCPRELSTFQIDEQITRSFGLRFQDGSKRRAALATIHAVFTGSVERFIYFHLDRIAKAEARGRRSSLPLWMSPTVVRIVLTGSSDLEHGRRLSEELERLGIRTDIDDRACSRDRKIAEADARLVPYQVLLGGEAATPSRVTVRMYEPGVEARMPLDELIARATCHRSKAMSCRSVSPRLSQQPRETL